MTRIFVASTFVLLAAFVGREPRAESPRYDFGLPEGVAPPRLPEGDPMSEAEVELGRRLFYDRRLSRNGTMSCASCHRQELAFTDGRAHPVGSTGEAVGRNSMGLANVGYRSRLTWANPLLARLEDQALLPMFGDTPSELGLDAPETFLARLRADDDYVSLFRAAFPDDPRPIRLARVTQSIAAFERTLVSMDSAYDRFVAGDARALDASAQRGLELFFSERLECFHCHGGFDFADSVDHGGGPSDAPPFHNTGLYDVDGRGSYPADDRGAIDVSERPEDMGRFRTPSLRNVAVTGPYMHDGSIDSLDAVIRHYEAGGRAFGGLRSAPGADATRHRDRFVTGFVLTDAERLDLIAFLESLTDEGFLHDPRFADPFR